MLEITKDNSGLCWDILNIGSLPLSFLSKSRKAWLLLTLIVVSIHGSIRLSLAEALELGRGHDGSYGRDESRVARAEVFIESDTGHSHSLLHVLNHLIVRLLLQLPLKLFLLCPLLLVRSRSTRVPLKLAARLLLGAFLLLDGLASCRTQSRLTAQLIRRLLGLLLANGLLSVRWRGRIGGFPAFLVVTRTLHFLRLGTVFILVRCSFLVAALLQALPWRAFLGLLILPLQLAITRAWRRAHDFNIRVVGTAIGSNIV